MKERKEMTLEEKATFLSICMVFVAIMAIFYGIYKLIESPSKDEVMASKGYVKIPIQHYSKSYNEWIYVPENSTEYKEFLKITIGGIKNEN